MYSISWRYHQNYKDVAQWNGITSPYLIHPGQWLRVVPAKLTTVRRVVSSSANAPLRDYTQPSVKPPFAEVAAQGEGPSVSSKPVVALVSVKKPLSVNFPALGADVVDKTNAVVASLSSRFPVSWQWPAQGVVVQRYNASSPGKKGIGIRAQRGASIYAAADGKVVYSGSGLKGYGNLVIIKHNDKYLSAYGHNHNLLVKDGDYVNKGQVIARMGDTESIGVKLHFEIRVDGKPQNPVRYLPKLGT